MGNCEPFNLHVCHSPEDLPPPYQMILRVQRPLPHRLILLGAFAFEQTQHAGIAPQTLSFEGK
jgi:hypothetical protein